MSEEPVARQGAGLRFSHIDDVPWYEAVAQKHGECRVGVHLKVLERRPERFVSYTRYDPGLVLARHSHRSDSTVFIIAGEVEIGGRRCSAGTLVVLEQGTVFGPLIAGPEGCILLECYEGDVTSQHEDDKVYEEMLAERGIVNLTRATD